MNSFQTINSGSGLLKNNYDDDDDEQMKALQNRSDALKMKVKLQDPNPDQETTLPTIVAANKLKR